MFIYNMEANLNELAQSMNDLCGQRFTTLWRVYDEAHGEPELKSLLWYCLQELRDEEKTPDERCTIWAFIYQVTYIDEDFMRNNNNIREISLRRANDLLQDDFVLARQSLVEILYRFKNKYM